MRPRYSCLVWCERNSYNSSPNKRRAVLPENHILEFRQHSVHGRRVAYRFFEDPFFVPTPRVAYTMADAG